MAPNLTSWDARVDLFRQRLETMLSQRHPLYRLAGLITMGAESKSVRKQDFKRVTVDTTMQEKAITYPRDAKWLARSRQRLVRLCKQPGVGLRQTYARVGPRAGRAAGLYARARQYRRMHRQVKRLRTCLGRVLRDVARRTEECRDLREVFARKLALAQRVYIPVPGRPTQVVQPARPGGGMHHQRQSAQAV